jgi:hypothetical protein
MIGGLTNNLNYRDFDNNLLFNFSFGVYPYDLSYSSLISGMQNMGSPGHTDLENRWQKPGDITEVPLLLTSQNDHSSASDRFLFNNDYVRLKAFTLGYNLPRSIIHKINLSKLRL